MTDNVLIQGPDLPVDCSFGKMITSPSGDGVILMGCQEHDDVYKMVADSNGYYHWEATGHSLQYSRNNPIVEYIHQGLVNCN